MVNLSLETEERYRRKDAKRLYYLSIEFLIGQSLVNNLLNLGLREACRRALCNPGADLDKIEESEPDAALGNGGLLSGFAGDSGHARLRLRHQLRIRPLQARD